MQFKDPRLIQMIRYENRPLYESGAEADYMNELNLRVYYNYLALIEPEDIPASLRLTDEEDPRQFSDKYIEEVIDWIKIFLGAKELHATDDEREVVRNFLRLCTTPEQYKAVKKFIFAHELSHLYFKHQVSFNELVEQSSTQRKTISVSAALFSSLVCASFTSSFLPILGVGVVVYPIAQVTLNKLEFLRVSRKQEREADLFAADHIGTAGGISLFQSIQNLRLSYIKNKKLTFFQKIFYNLAVNNEGDVRFSWFHTHPSDSQRIHYLSKHGKK